MTLNGFSVPAFRVAIPCLFRTGRPSAVVGGIRPIVVDSINGMQGTGTPPHIGQEIRKAAAPPLTDSDPSATITIPPPTVRASATSSHCRPDEVLWHGASPDSGAVSGVSGYDSFSVQTSARTRVAGAQIGRRDCEFSTAIASTEPRCLCGTAHPSDSYQSSKSLSGKVEKGRHSSVKDTLFTFRALVGKRA